jgi:hypothetical protein
MNARQCSRPAGSTPTRRDRPRCARPCRVGPTESGRSRAATALVARWRNGCWQMASTSSTGRPSCRHEHGCSTPATTARPTPTTRTRSPRSRSAPRGWECCPTTSSSRRCRCSRTVETHPVRIQTVNRLHRLLSELIPGKAKKDITTGQAQSAVLEVEVAGAEGDELAPAQSGLDRGLDHQPVLVGDRLDQPSALVRGEGAGLPLDYLGELGVSAHGLKVMTRSRTARVNTECSIVWYVRTLAGEARRRWRWW